MRRSSGCVMRRARRTRQHRIYANDIEDLIEFDLQSFTLQNTEQGRRFAAWKSATNTAVSICLHAELVRQTADNA